MSYSVPDGSTLSLGTAFGSAKTITAITNANPAVASATAHGFTAGDIVVITSGWERLNNRIARVASPTTDAFTLEGFDTSDTDLYPAGTSAGTATEVTAFTQITQILGVTTSGGEQQFATVSPLESEFEIQIPTNYSAQSLALEIADDPTLAGYTAIKAAAESRAVRPLLMLNKNGSKIYYYGYVSLNETPTKNKGQVDTVASSFALLSRPTRYAS
jgi:hypothetical protein